MAVARNSESVTIGIVDNGTSISVNHTAGSGSDLMAVATVHTTFATGITGVTYNSVAMTSRASIAASSEASYIAAIFTHPAPATSSQAVAATFPAACYATMGVSTYTGVDQTSPVSWASSGRGAANGNSWETTATTAADEIIVDALVAGTGAAGIVAGANQTALVDQENQFSVYAESSWQDGADGGLMSWSGWTPSGTHTAQSVISLKAAGAGGGTTAARHFMHYQKLRRAA